MLLLTSTSDLIQVITSTAAAVQVHASWVDLNAGVTTPGRTNTVISSATTTSVVASPAASTQRNVQSLFVSNVDASLSDTVVIKHTDGTNAVELISAVLANGESVEFVYGRGWTVFDINGGIKTAYSIPAGTVTNAALANMAAATVKGSIAGGVPADLTKQQSLTMFNLAVQGPEAVIVFGHSYMMDTICTYDQSSATAAILRSALRIDTNNWQNYCNTGARVSSDNAKHIGSWVHVLNNLRIRGTNSTKKIAPYTAGVGGLVVFCYGINDLGHDTDTSQEKAAFISAMRTCISRARSAIVWDNTDAAFAYGAGFVSTTAVPNLSTMGTLRRATTTTAATITFTIPADYNGEVIAMCFIGKPGVVGGTITFSGTAGWTGTLSTSNIKATADATNCPVVKRATAPVTGTTQTIIATCSQIDASGNVDFDSAWLESKYPPPVLVQNIARLTATGQAFWAEWSVGGSEAIRDASVNSWNAALVSLVAEFDSMVQIWDMDTALGPKNVAYFSSVAPSQTHPNELGAARAVDQALVALNNLTVAGGQGWSANVYPASPSRGGLRTGFISPHWYYTPGARISAATYASVAGDMFAVPFQITEGITRFDTVGIECTNAPTTGTTIRLGIYYNDGQTPQHDYPGGLFHEINAGLAAGTTAALKSAAISEEMDPGLWWLVFLVNVAPATAAIWRQIDGPVPGMPSLATTGLPISGVLGPVAWKLTGIANALLPFVFPTGAALVASAPFIGLRTAVPN